MKFAELKKDDWFVYAKFKKTLFLKVRTTEKTATHLIIKSGKTTIKIPNKYSNKYEFESKDFIVFSDFINAKWFLENTISEAEKDLKKNKKAEWEQFKQTNKNSKIYIFDQKELTIWGEEGFGKDWQVRGIDLERAMTSWPKKNFWYDYTCGYHVLIVGFINLCRLNAGNTTEKDEFLLIEKERQIIKEKYLGRF